MAQGAQLVCGISLGVVGLGVGQACRRESGNSRNDLRCDLLLQVAQAAHVCYSLGRRLARYVVERLAILLLGNVFSPGRVCSPFVYSPLRINASSQGWSLKVC